MEVSIECDSTCLVLSAVTSIDSALFKPAKTRPVALSSLYETAPDGSDRVRLLENDSVDFYIDAGATGGSGYGRTHARRQHAQCVALERRPRRAKADDVRHRIHGFAGCRQRSDLPRC